MPKLLLAVSTALLLASATPAFAQSELDIRLHETHVNCDRGDRAACVRFGIILGAHPEKLAEWRRTHAEWFWWDHR